MFGDARRALAVIEIGLSDGSTIHAIDVFTVEGDLIRSFPAAGG